MCFGGDGGAGDIARAQRQDEIDRQNRIKAGMSRIDQIFKGFDDAYYKKQGDAYSAYATPQLDRSYRDAKDNMIYALDRSGILSSSAAIKKNADLTNEFDQNRLDIANKAQTVANDARAPMEDGGLAMRLDCVPFAIVVNRNVERFYDEGEDVWPKRYAIWGRLIAQQPGQVALAVTDSQAVMNFLPSVYPPYKADSIAGIAQQAGMDAAKLEKVVADYNAAVVPGTFTPMTPDDCRTEGLVPPKSHWARRIDRPPYYAYPLRPGITFTFLSVKVDDKARVLMADGKPSGNMFASGEIMSGNILGQGYLAGFGMTLGTVFGRLAGEGAAKHVRN